MTAHDFARRSGGRFLLRIEDIDTTRSRPEFERALVEDLPWLGVAWDEAPLRQSEHLEDYRAALARLQELGVVYRCFRTRAELMADIGRAPHGAEAATAPGPLTPNEEERLMAEDRPFAWRLAIDKALERLSWPKLKFLEEGAGPAGERGRITAQPPRLGDIVVARKDLGVSYHLAVVIDDARQGITHVVRGCDLFEAAHVQRLLQALLGLPTPTYRHHRLLLRPDGKRYSKRDTAETLRGLRARGASPAQLRSEMGLDALED
jgi:glutamyl-Q tRNA(Asp) synthetase